VAGAGHVPRMALSVSLIVIVRVCKSHGRPESGWKRERGSDYIRKVIESLKGIFLACFKPVNRKKGASWVA
jgi:hypothetical protein